MQATQFSENGIHTEQTCPVCATTNEATAQHCTTCAWYFPLKNTPQYALELSRAKQQFQMIQSFNQVYQHMQIQSKVLEKMSFRLDGLEADMKKVKEENFIVVNPELTEEVDYPELEPIAQAEDFDTPEKRLAWWNDLEEQWQRAFNASFLQKGETTDTPTDEELVDIFSTPTFRVVGPRGMYPSIGFELTNASGVKHLTNLKYLFITHCGLTNLEGTEHLHQVETLYVNSNKLTDISAVHYMTKLYKLFVNANQLTSILPVKDLALETLYCNYNQLANLHGITKEHQAKLKEFYCLPNDNVQPKEIERIEKGLGIKCSKA
ncbi:MAG: hypothetical protein AAF960_26970 [Bacteroidota bacterium]